MNPLKSAISSLNYSGFENIDKNIFNDLYLYKNISLYNIAFRNEGIFYQLSATPFSHKKI